MIEKFERRLLTGKLNVACKFDDGSVRYWKDQKENVVANIVRIVNEYAKMNYRLTLRQLHYQFVGHVPNYVNHQTAYKKLGQILDDCRYGGVIDWDAIVDRGRNPYLPYCNLNPKHALEDAVETYRIDRQENQTIHIEVWVEKDALSEILRRSTEKYHIRLCVNKGHTSSSAMYEAYERFRDIINNGQEVIVLYIGDHDPSGLDMIRDIDTRLRFMLENGLHSEGDSSGLTVRPICLNINQVKKYKLPPNPTKITDSRSEGYIKTYGKSCWEVDALAPEVLTEILESNIEAEIDLELFEEKLLQEQSEKNLLKGLIKKLK